MRGDYWLTAEEAEQERKFIGWCQHWALPVAGSLSLIVLALALWALWTVSALVFT